MAVEYGTIAVVPMGTWENSKDYDVGNLVELDGSSYVAKVKPPAGMLPTDTAYWQISAKGASKATVDIAGVVKPDGVTTEVDANASLSVKKATQATVGIVKGSNGIKVGAEGSIDVDTTFTQATDLANIIAGEAIASVLGKVSKAIATTMSLDQNALLKNMLTSIDGNSSEKVPTQAYIHTLVERIGMGTELTAGANLTEVANELSSNLGNISDDINPLKSNYVSHINVNVLNKVNLVLWDANTADTPFKAGNTVYGNGFCITYSSGVEQWLCQLAMAVGDSHLFTRHQREGVWSGWTTIGSPSS